MIKLIFTDLDQTLLDDNKEIPLNNIKAISKARDKGAELIFSTGRIPLIFKNYSKQLSVSSYVASNGSFVVYNNKTLYEKYIDKEHARILLEIAVREKIYTRIFSKDWLYLFNFSDDYKNYPVYTESCKISESEIRKVVNNVNIFKFIFLCNDSKRIEKLKKELNSLGMGVMAIFSGKDCLEVGPSDVSKGNGLKMIADYTNTDISDTIAIGDNENDISMLKIAGISACPSNGIDEVKDIVDYKAKSSNNDGVLAEIVEKYL